MVRIFIFNWVLIFTFASSDGKMLISKMSDTSELRDAVNLQKVAVKIGGANDPALYRETVDQEGLHYGKCIVLSLVSNSNNTELLKLASGTLLIPDDPDVQVMITTHSLELKLKPGERITTKIYAMCTEMKKYAPCIDQDFHIGSKANDTLTHLVEYLEQTYNQNMIGQHALWALTDHATADDLKAFGADSNALNKTRNILDAANIATDLNKPLAVVTAVPISEGSQGSNNAPYLMTIVLIVAACRLAKRVLKNTAHTKFA